jgi:two-component system sensor histidine kinase KdpD
VDLLVVGGEATEQPAPAVSIDEPERRDAGSKWRAYGEAAVAVTVISVIALFLRDHIDVTNIAMLYLIAVVWVSARTGRGPAIAASVVGVAVFDFICVPPYFTFAVSDTEYLLTFAVMLMVALTITELTAGMRYQARIAAHRERRAAALAAMSRELSGALTAQQIAEIAVQHVRGVFEAPSTVLLPDREERLHVAPEGRPNPLPNVDLSVAQWVHDRWEPAGLGTDTLAGTPIHYVPLRAPVRNRGVLALAPRNERLIFVPEQRRLLDTFAAQIALALERVHFVEVAQEAEIGMSSERLRNSLLASISHDLRTPLAVIAGAAGSLVEQELTAEARRELIATIHDQALSMSELTANVLDMARFETGAVQLNRQWHPFEEVVGVVLDRLHMRLEGRHVDVDLSKSPPLVWLDTVLIGQVLTNLLDNAVKYTPARSPIELSAAAVPDGVEVAVSDHGVGLLPGQEQRVFDKFYRAHPEGATGGAGLGLAICRAIVEAHRGHIRADNRSGGGVRFSFVLPQPSQPVGPLPEVEATDSDE